MSITNYTAVTSDVAISCGQVASSVTLLTVASDLKRLVDKHLERLGSNEKIAAAIGMSNSGFLRAVKKGRISLENGLRLAALLGESADEILRAGDQTAMADLIMRLYGAPRPVPVPTVERVAGEFVVLRSAIDRLEATVAAGLPLPRSPSRHREGPPESPPAIADRPRTTPGRLAAGSRKRRPA